MNIFRGYAKRCSIFWFDVPFLPLLTELPHSVSDQTAEEGAEQIHCPEHHPHKEEWPAGQEDDSVETLADVDSER